MDAVDVTRAEERPDGVRARHDAGGRVIARDGGTSAICETPKRAVETGHVDSTLPIGAVARGIVDAAIEFVEEGVA